MSSCRPIVLPGESVDHSMAVALLCRNCENLVPIEWGSNRTGVASCDCGYRYGYKQSRDAFVRA